MDVWIKQSFKITSTGDEANSFLTKGSTSFVGDYEIKVINNEIFIIFKNKILFIFKNHIDYVASETGSLRFLNFNGISFEMQRIFDKILITIKNLNNFRIKLFLLLCQKQKINLFFNFKTDIQKFLGFDFKEIDNDIDYIMKVKNQYHYRSIIDMIDFVYE